VIIKPSRSNWTPSPKHWASNKPGTLETTLWQSELRPRRTCLIWCWDCQMTTLANMVLGLTWTASRCCLIFLRMQCRPVETRPNVVPRKAALKILVGTRAKTILGSYTAAQVRSSECEPWPANKFSSLPDAPGVELLNDIPSTTPLQSASLMADPKLKMQ
jgi:hypothetical protein